jgi:hypothetical protein
VLFEEYKKYLDKYIEKIVDILILEGKKTLGDQVSGGIISFSNLIYTDNYFFTTFDLWLLVTKYEIPTVFISPHYILQTKYSKRTFIAYGERNDQFAFIIIPGFTAEKIPTFKLITSSEKEAFISIDKLSGECLDNIQEALNNKESIESYLEKFTKPNTKKKKPLPFNIEEGFENELINLLTELRNAREPEPQQEIQDVLGIERIVLREMLLYALFNNMITTIREQYNAVRKLNILSSVENNENENINENCECNICWEEKEKKNFVKFGCNHEFCKDCVIKTLRTDQRENPCCALCRAEVKSIVSRTNLVQTELADIIA